MQKLLLVAVILLVTIGSLRADEVLLPAEGIREYQSTEISTHVEGPVRSVVTVKVGKELFEEKELVKLETISKDAAVKTELLGVVSDDLVCVARAGSDGKIVKLEPPEIIVSAPLRVGAKWEQEGEAGGVRMRQRWAVVAEESVTVPAGQFQAFRLHCEASSLIAVKLDRWFVPGQGIVKEVAVVRSPGLLHRVTLELQKVKEAPSKPELPPASPAPQPPAQSSASPQPMAASSPPGTPAEAIGPSVEKQASKQLTVEVSSDPAGGLMTEFKSNVKNVYVRWHGHGLPELATVRVAWVAEDVGDLVEPNFIVDETETVAAAPDASARFTLSRPPDGWAEGKYRVEFYVNDSLVETVRVTIGK